MKHSVQEPASVRQVSTGADGMGREETARELEAIHPDSFGWALACCRWNREEAQDVLQAAYVKAMEGRARFNGDSSLRSWFFGVVLRTAAEHRRKRTVRDSALLRWFRRRPQEREVPTPEKLSGNAETREQLLRLLERLSRRQRDLLHLVFYQGLTIEEAACVLSISVGTARTHYERGKARMRELFAESGES